MTEENKPKRKKASPFSREDELLLLHAIYAEKNIIECKETNKFSIAEKDKAWGRVAMAYVSKASEFRNIDQLRSKFDNLKTKTRKVVAQERAHMRGTGGGGPLLTNNDPILDLVLKIVNEKTVFGLENCYDNDSITSDSKRTNAISIDDLMDSDQVLILQIDEGDENVAGAQTADRSSHEAILKESNYNEPLQIAKQSDNNETPLTAKKIAKHTWEDYTPRKLKEPVNRKLRPTTVSTLAIAKENYYKKKAELIAEELQLRKEQNRRKEEDHILKQQLLELEVEMKKEQLKRYKNDL